MCTNFNNFFRRCLCNIPKLNSSDSPGSSDEFTGPILLPHHAVYLVNSSLLLILNSALGNLLFATWYFWREIWKVNHGHLGTAKTNQQVGIFMGIPSHASHFVIIWILLLFIFFIFNIKHVLSNRRYSKFLLLLLNIILSLIVFERARSKALNIYKRDPSAFEANSSQPRPLWVPFNYTRLRLLNLQLHLVPN